MRICFYLPLRLFSLNSVYCKNRSFKTRDYRDWERAVLYALVEPGPKAELAKLRESFDPKTSALSLQLISYIPQDSLFNKQGSLSSRSLDLTNVEKPIVDILMLPRYHQVLQGMGGGNVNIDDKHIVSLKSCKRLSRDTKHWLKVRLAVVPLSSLNPGPLKP